MTGWWRRPIHSRGPRRQMAGVAGMASAAREAGIAQLAEQLICNQQVVGSIPTAGSGALLDPIYTGTKANSGHEIHKQQPRLVNPR